jgi:hypothetical protein
LNKLNLYTKSTAKQSWWQLVPCLGAAIFCGLYVLAAFYYPGGSQNNRHSIGFSLLDNYWCNLLNNDALNGEPNVGRPYAIAAMVVLSCSLLFFWWQFSSLITWSRLLKYLVQVSGTISALTMLLLPFSNHDVVVNLAAFFGGVALVCVLIVLRKWHWQQLFRVGTFNLLLIGINNIVYYTENLLYMLPVVQKFTFLFFICWIAAISLQIYRKPF